MKIEKLHGRRVWDSRGLPTVEAEIVLAGGAVGRAIAPAGASRGSAEAVDLRDGGAAFGGRGVAGAVHALNAIIAPSLIGLDAADQKRIDQTLIDLDGTPQKSRLGGNATIAASMAAAYAAASSSRQPLWSYLSGGAALRLPMPIVQLFGGGAHAGGRIDVQDILIVPVKAASFDEATEIVAEVYRAGGLLMAERGLLRGVADEGGWWPEFASNEAALETTVRSIERAGFRPGEDVAIALDVAASQFAHDGRYRLAADGVELSSDEFVARLVGWCARYPIISVEDPVGENDHGGMRAFTRAVGERVQVIGDDYLVTSARRIEAAAKSGACNAALLKPNQAGTLTETFDALQAARRAGWRTVISARSGETEDVTIVHLAVGWGADQLKVGSFARSERMAKWNEAIRIEKRLGARATFAGRGAIGGSLPTRR
jgi:enolase